MHYLYRITNQINGKIYIGQTICPDKRWYDHRNRAANPVQIISRAMHKYGTHNFDFEVIATAKLREDANFLEILLIQQYESHISTKKGYNTSLGGEGHLHSETTKQKLSSSLKKRLAEQGHPLQGKHHSEESKQKMSESSKGQIAWNAGLTNCFSQETLQKMSKAKKGGKASEETKQKMAVSRTKNRKCSIEGCDNRHDAKGFCSKHYYHLVDKENRPWSDRKHLRKSRNTNKL